MLLVDIDIINLYEIEQIDFGMLECVTLKLYHLKLKLQHIKVMIYDTM